MSQTVELTPEELTILVNAKTEMRGDEGDFVSLVLAHYPKIGVEVMRKLYPVTHDQTMIVVIGGYDVHARILELRDIKKLWITEGKKVDAIKLTRQLYGVGLKEAKDFVEQFDWNRVL